MPIPDPRDHGCKRILHRRKIFEQEHKQNGDDRRFGGMARKKRRNQEENQPGARKGHERREDLGKICLIRVIAIEKNRGKDRRQDDRQQRDPPFFYKLFHFLSFLTFVQFVA